MMEIVGQTGGGQPHTLQPSCTHSVRNVGCVKRELSESAEETSGREGEARSAR